MFSDTLSGSMLRLCENLKLSYEVPAERCNISTRYFGSIVRKEVSPSVHVLEKICTGFQQTPNDLLITPSQQAQLTYRQTMQVSHVKVIHLCNGLTAYPIFPRCKLTLERDYQNYCDRCGQRLGWDNYENVDIVY